MTAPRRRWLALALLLAGVCAAVAWRQWHSVIKNWEGEHRWRQADSDLNHYKGMTPNEVLGHLGPPTNQWAGYFGLPGFPDSEEINPESWVYNRQADDLYLSFNDRNGRRECFISQSVQKGAVF
jgi:hypothetical protein